MPVPERIRRKLLSYPIGVPITRALSRFYERDEYLLELDVNERSITHRLGMYLQEEFQDMDVDCEYNRDGVEPKRIGRLAIEPHLEDTEGRTAYPDIIVHRRGEKTNLLVIEVKKSTNFVEDPTSPRFE